MEDRLIISAAYKEFSNIEIRTQLINYVLENN